MGKQFTADFLLQVMNDNNRSPSLALFLPPSLFFDSDLVSSSLLSSVHYSSSLSKHCWKTEMASQRQTERERNKGRGKRDDDGRKTEWRTDHVQTMSWTETVVNVKHLLNNPDTKFREALRPIIFHHRPFSRLLLVFFIYLIKKPHGIPSVCKRDK